MTYTQTISPPRRSLNRSAAALALAALLCPALLASAMPGGHDLEARPQASTPAPALRDVKIEQKLDAQVPPDLTFRDEAGKAVRLGDYFGVRPVVLSLVYYKCPGLCSVSITEEERAFRGIANLDVGRDFDVITVSIDPAEQPDLAAAKKADYLRLYNRPGAESGWHFLTGEQDSIRRLADAVGFRYKWDEEQKQFLHSGGIMVLTPAGRVSRYFLGVDYPPTDLRLALGDATGSKIGAPTQQVVLYCFIRDPHTGKIVLRTQQALRVAGVVTIASLVTFVLFMIRRDRPAGGFPVPAPGRGFA